jgi:hypothetical protein
MKDTNEKKRQTRSEQALARKTLSQIQKLYFDSGVKIRKSLVDADAIMTKPGTTDDTNAQLRELKENLNMRLQEGEEQSKARTVQDYPLLEAMDVEFNEVLKLKQQILKSYDQAFKFKGVVDNKISEGLRNAKKRRSDDQGWSR